MENMKVKELREKYGIHDSRNEYTEEQLIKLSQQKLYYIRPNKEDASGTIPVEYKQVFGYVSEDEKACIFIKDSTITGNNNSYYPVKLIRNCKKIKEGIYHDRVDDVIYCTTEDLQFCLDYEKKYVEAEIQEQIKELEQDSLKLRNTKIIYNPVEQNG